MFFVLLVLGKWRYVVYCSCLVNGAMFCIAGVCITALCFILLVFGKWRYVLYCWCLVNGVMFCIVGVW